MSSHVSGLQNSPDQYELNIKDQTTTCFVFRWWVGDWQKCSSICGDVGISKRTVLCIRSVGLDERRALLPSECQHLSKPEAIASCNTHMLCPADWITGNWSEVSVSLFYTYYLNSIININDL